MLFNAISAHQQKLVDDAEAAKAEQAAATEKRRTENEKRMAEATGAATAGQKRNFLDALREKREVRRRRHYCHHH